MAYDELLATRIRDHLAGTDGLTERKMFGGIAFMINGNMCCGVTGTALMLRLGNEGADAALAEPHVRPMDFTGKPLRSMVYVDPVGTETNEGLASWIDRAVRFAQSLPPR